MPSTAHRDAVHLEGLGLEGVGGLPRLHAGPLVGLVHVSLRPVGTEGAQHQPRHDALPLVQGREPAHEGDEGVGAGVEQVVVAEGAQGVVVRVHLPNAGLGVVGGQLAAHHLVVEAAGHQRHAVHVPGQLKGEGLGDGDGLEEVLDAQEGALPRPRRRHREKHRVLPVAAVSKEDFLRVQLHRCYSFL